MKVLYRCKPTLMKGGGERYNDLLTERLSEHVDLTVSHWGEKPPEGDWDLVHTEWKLDDALLAKRKGAALVFTVHISPLDLVKYGWMSGRRGLYRIPQAAIYAKRLAEAAAYLAAVDGVIAVSPSAAKGLRRHFPPAADKIHVVENGVNVDRFTPEGGSDGGYGLYLGRLEWVKGPDLAIEAFRRLGHPLKIVGKGGMRDKLHEQAKGADVEFIEDASDDDIIDLYRNASLAVFPSYNEGYPFVVLEALSCGTPVVSGKSFECRPPVSDEIFWHECGDVDDLTRAVREAWGTKTPERAKELHGMIREHRNLDRVVEETVDAYRKAYERRKGR